MPMLDYKRPLSIIIISSKIFFNLNNPLYLCHQAACGLSVLLTLSSSIMSEQEKYQIIIQAFKEKAAQILPAGSRVALYGSRARGDSRPDSDWDLHILIPGEEKLPLSMWDKYAWPFSEIGLYLNEDINPRLYSFAGWLKRSFLPFYKNVEKDAVIIFQN